MLEQKRTSRPFSGSTRSTAFALGLGPPDSVLLGAPFHVLPDGRIYDPFNPPIPEYQDKLTTHIAMGVNDETAKQLRASTRGRAPIKYGHAPTTLCTASTIGSDRIGQTQVARAQSYADIAAWDQSGLVMAKEWCTARDERVSRFCSPMYERIIDLEDNFFGKCDIQVGSGKNRKGDEANLTYHHDYDNVPDCRCIRTAAARCYPSGSKAVVLLLGLHVKVGQSHHPLDDAVYSLCPLLWLKAFNQTFGPKKSSELHRLKEELPQLSGGF